MKVKRFLLRYDPPGIGLEVEDATGELEVRHKPLPPAKEVRTVYDIADLVEDLCTNEMGLLSMRKHGMTLTQLLGRLYQVETSGALPSDEDRSRDSSSSPTKELTSPTNETRRLKEGQRVVLSGLEGKMLAHNGKVATVLKAKHSKDKYEVCMSSDRHDQFETLKVKGSEHLLSMLHASQPLAVGTSVVLCRLRNHMELNGATGYVVECNENSQRYEVRTTQTSQLFRVKFENVVAVEAPASVLGSTAKAQTKASPEPGKLKRPSSTAQLTGVPSGASLESAGQTLVSPGAIVEIVGLRSNTAFNGEQAKVLSVDMDTRKYEILMSDGAVRKVKFENARDMS